jgi:UDP-2,3-diacylglucosamine pyrophosphatase LpxH
MAGSNQPPDGAPLVARAVFVSDFHLGAASCNAEAILRFLHRLQCAELYLVGDIIDGYIATHKGKWLPIHTEVVRAVLELAEHGTNVHFCPGNHDAFMRHALGMEFGNIEIDDAFVHETANGRTLLVTHGDLFDGTVSKSVILPWLGTWIHEGMTVLNQRINRRRVRKQRSPVDIANALKRVVKRLTKRLTSFEENITEHAQDNGFDGVICGHIHAPLIITAPNGCEYLNCGDWMGNCTGIMEDFDGNLRLFCWSEFEPIPVLVGATKAPKLRS